MKAIGELAGQTRRVILPFVFAAALACVPSSAWAHVQAGKAGGFLTAFSIRSPAGTAVFHGHAHGTELPPGNDG